MSNPTGQPDLTTGPIFRHLVRLSIPLVLSMLMQTLYNLVDLYFVGRLGSDAVAAVSIAGNAFFIILGLSVVVGTGATTLISQAWGRKEPGQADRIFGQSLYLALLIGAGAGITGFFGAERFIEFFGGQGDSLRYGARYFRIFAVSFTSLIVLFTIGSAFRGAGNTKTPMLIMAQSTLLNLVLDPILIFGLLGFPRLGVAGAAWASLAAQVYALGVYAWLIVKGRSPVRPRGFRFDRSLAWKSLAIGLPSGISYYFLAFNLMITYRVVTEYGTEALASLGVGFRILQAGYLPIVAITSAAAILIGQNYGAGLIHRVRRTFKTGWLAAVVGMVGISAVQLIFTRDLLGFFGRDPALLDFGTTYLTIYALANPVVGSIMACTSTFQGLGKTYPNLIGAFTDNALFALAVLTLPGLMGWGFAAIWWMKFGTAVVELVVIGGWLLKDLAVLKPPRKKPEKKEKIPA